MNYSHPQFSNARFDAIRVRVIMRAYQDLTSVAKLLSCLNGLAERIGSQELLHIVINLRVALLREFSRRYSTADGEATKKAIPPVGDRLPYGKTKWSRGHTVVASTTALQVVR